LPQWSAQWLYNFLSILRLPILRVDFMGREIYLNS
jgi:hypothetical protein